MSTNVLADRDVNTSAPSPTKSVEGDMRDVKSMEHHRQVLQSKLADEGKNGTYISPSDTIMSPTTAKLATMRNKRLMKTQPQSLFSHRPSNGSTLSGGPIFGSNNSHSNEGSTFTAQPVAFTHAIPRLGSSTSQDQDMFSLPKENGGSRER